MPNPQMCYERNFLSQVILRADFTSHPLGALQERTPFSDRIANIFPHVESQAQMQMSFSLTPSGGGVEQQILGNQWIHKKRVDSTARTTLGPNFLTLEYGANDYTSFVNFQTEFTAVFNALTENFGIAQIDRIGLRYVNEIRLQEGKALDWDGIIAPNLISSVNASMRSDARMLRSMHQVIQLKGEDQLLLTYGIVNPDFPAPVVQRNFVLDIDASRQGLIESGEALRCIATLNVLATDVFEASIDQKLRETMGIVR